VGKQGKNKYRDVFAVQRLLNGCMHLLKTSKTLDLDGKIGASTLAAIEEFQKTVMNVTAPDGRVDPNGMSMLHLELYSGKVTGPLTNPSNKPYLRRSDLIEPTSILDKAN